MNRRGFMQTLFGGVVATLLPRQVKAKDVKGGRLLPLDVQDELVSKLCNTTTDFCMKRPRLYPCEKAGNHKVENIKPIGSSDEGDRILRTQYGYKWRGTCVHCRGSIVAKDKSEYDTVYVIL